MANDFWESMGRFVLEPAYYYTKAAVAGASVAMLVVAVFVMFTGHSRPQFRLKDMLAVVAAFAMLFALRRL